MSFDTSFERSHPPNADLRICYWCKHPDHGKGICPVPYTAINEKGITNSYPCGCSQSTTLIQEMSEREQIARTVERMYGPHDRRFKTAIEIADMIRKG